MIKFDYRTHTYDLEGKTLISVTQLLKKHGIAPDYSGVDEETLRRKAERGELIHTEIENYIKYGELGFTQEFDDFIDLANKLGLTDMKSEQIVHNDLVAGKVDLTALSNGEKIIADFKTTVTVDKNYLRWQLSLYNYLGGFNSDEFICFHLGEKSRVISLEPVSTSEIEKLLECERNGKIYAPELNVDTNLLAELRNVELIIKKAKEEAEGAKAREDILKQKLIEAMRANGVKSYENDFIKITYVEPCTRETIDTKALKADYPEIAVKVLRVSQVAPGVRVTLRG